MCVLICLHNIFLNISLSKERRVRYDKNVYILRVKSLLLCICGLNF
jgi:hypothetical protein